MNDRIRVAVYIALCKASVAYADDRTYGVDKLLAIGEELFSKIEAYYATKEEKSMKTVNASEDSEGEGPGPIITEMVINTFDPSMDRIWGSQVYRCPDCNHGISAHATKTSRNDRYCGVGRCECELTPNGVVELLLLGERARELGQIKIDATKSTTGGIYTPCVQCHHSEYSHRRAMTEEPTNCVAVGCSCKKFVRAGEVDE